MLNNVQKVSLNLGKVSEANEALLKKNNLVCANMLLYVVSHA